MPADARKTTVRRPRMTPDRELELLVATLDVLREDGYEALTMDAVAAKARCSKATLYRQWQTKPEMIAAALYATRPVRVNEIDTGSLRGDLMLLVEQVAPRAQQDTALFTALGHAALSDPALVRALRESVIDPETANLTAFVDRAVARGELAARPAALAFLPQLLFSSLHTRPLFQNAVADYDYLVGFIDDVVMPVLLHT
ncbi:TetR/AcrR family transcriptional regulator [Streptomyces sp. RKAG337]|uniref:TetR/AcrR family transcriptional regulator n=1 Tax=Streptomyces sp. RKAG337 TaxID=2893404 RepID=UPI00203399E9|nr:TetR/AcrR family transcriptional regulator [Streptomyces sp. RKAG337]MCM2430591.1 TetR/AcrR family transcriptional regulator [Streptomyces sp. RKAG337]